MIQRVFDFDYLEDIYTIIQEHYIPNLYTHISVHRVGLPRRPDDSILLMYGL